jgi:hypothetical protein
MALITNLLVDVLEGTDDHDLIVGAGRNKVLLGKGGNDYIIGVQHTDIIYDGDGDDTTIGWSGNDTIVGNPGNDLLVGNYDDDWLVGGFGFDTLYGGNGHDTLFGGQDINRLLGGLGGDLFAIQPVVRREHEETPVTVRVGQHEETVVTFTVEIIDPPPREETTVVREDAPGRPNEHADRSAWDNYIQHAIDRGYTLVEYNPTDTQQLFPTYYREETQTLVVDPPPQAVEVEHVTTVVVPDYEVQFTVVDRTLLTFDGMAIVLDFTPGIDHLWLAGVDVPIGAETSVLARDVNGQLTLSYDGMDIAALPGHTASEYSTSWWA